MIPYYSFLPYPFLPPNCDKPPTVYSIMESIIKYKNKDNIKIVNLAKETHSMIFDFEYPLSNNINKEYFECMILNNFIMRRIGFETVTAFKIQLNVKLNEIMPIYNKMFDSLENWDLFNDGEIEEKEGNILKVTNTKNVNDTTNTLENTSNTENEEIADKRYSSTPQSQLDNVRNGSYVTEYSYDTTNSKSNDKSNSKGNSISNNVTDTNDNNNYKEKTKRTPSDKITLYKEFQENIKSIYSMIFKDLECLFYTIYS